MLPDEIWDHVRQKPGRRKENGKKEDEHHEGEHCQDTPRAQDDAENLRPPVGLFQDAPCAPAIQIFQLCKLDSRLAGQPAKANVVLLFANFPRFRKNVCPCTANPAEQISAVTEGEAEGGNRVFPEQPPDKPRGRLDIVRKRLDSFHPVEEVPHEECAEGEVYLVLSPGGPPRDLGQKRRKPVLEGIESLVPVAMLDPEQLFFVVEPVGEPDGVGIDVSDFPVPSPRRFPLPPSSNT